MKYLYIGKYISYLIDIENKTFQGYILKEKKFSDEAKLKYNVNDSDDNYDSYDIVGFPLKLRMPKPDLRRAKPLIVNTNGSVFCELELQSPFKNPTPEENSKALLELHKIKLEKRSFEYRFAIFGRFLSFFKEGYSKTEKLEAINKYLNGKNLSGRDETILNQGRTGKIMRNGS